MKGIFAEANGLANLDLCKLTIQAGEASIAGKPFLTYS
jgi:hypothetical protein